MTHFDYITKQFIQYYYSTENQISGARCFKIAQQNVNKTHVYI